MGVTIDNLTFTYEGRENPALSNINITIKSGEKVLVTGRSGSGKSTLLRCINGIIPNVYLGKLDGSVYINNTDVTKFPLSKISLIAGTVLQDVESQLFNTRVEDEIAFGMENLGFGKGFMEERIKKLCNIFDFERKGEIKSLSGGKKQKLLMSSILAMDRDYIFFDEPLSNIDRYGVEQFREFLRGELLKDKTIIVVEHRTELILNEVDRVIVLENGKVKYDLKPAEYINGCIEKDENPSLEMALSPQKTLNACEKDNRNVIYAKNLSVKVKAKTILENINLEVKRGEKLCILGENGAGKSTLLRSFCGLSEKIHGDLEIGGRNAKKYRNGKLADIVGYVYQNPNYQLFMNTVKREIGFKCSLMHEMEEFFKTFNIDSIKDRHPFSLSEGQKRLITIGAVALTGANILLLDEPTIGQDSTALLKIMYFLNMLNEKYKTTIVMVTHDYRAAKYLNGRYVVINKGRIEMDGGREIILDYFKHKDKERYA